MLKTVKASKLHGMRSVFVTEFLTHGLPMIGHYVFIDDDYNIYVLFLQACFADGSPSSVVSRIGRVVSLKRYTDTVDQDVKLLLSASNVNGDVLYLNEDGLFGDSDNDETIFVEGEVKKPELWLRVKLCKK